MPKWHCIARFVFTSVSGVSRTKIAEVTLNALRTRQSLVKGERLVRHEMRAVLRYFCWTQLGNRLAAAPPGRLAAHASEKRNDFENGKNTVVRNGMIGIQLPKRVCHTQRGCKARGDKRIGPKQASNTNSPAKNRCEKRAIS